MTIIALKTEYSNLKVLINAEDYFHDQVRSLSKSKVQELIFPCFLTYASDGMIL